MSDTQQEFFSLAIDNKALLFGDFTLKSGKKSPYFFNISSFFEGGMLHELSLMYLDIVNKEGLEFDVIFGPAYKGIPLASALSTQLTKLDSKRYPVCFDRKEKKDHGEGGHLIGNVENKKVLIVDDVLTAGTALENSIEVVNNAGGNVIAAIVGLDREEVVDKKPVKEVLQRDLGIPIYSIASISSLLDFLESEDRFSSYFEIIKKYYEN